MQPSDFCPHVLSSLTFSLLSAPLCSWASSSDGPVSTCSPSGVGPGAASGDPEPPSAPVPKELPPVPVTDTSRTDWENAHTTRSSAERGDAGWKSVTILRALHMMDFKKAWKGKMLDRTAEEVLGFKTKTRTAPASSGPPAAFSSVFWLEINYSWWYPISVSLTQTENPSYWHSVVQRLRVKTTTATKWWGWRVAETKHTISIPWRPFWHSLWPYHCCWILWCVFMALIAQEAGCGAQTLTRILALSFFLQCDWKPDRQLTSHTQSLLQQDR